MNFGLFVSPLGILDKCLQLLFLRVAEVDEGPQARARRPFWSSIELGERA
jgi:hypothetical protein